MSLVLQAAGHATNVNVTIESPILPPGARSISVNISPFISSDLITDFFEPTEDGKPHHHDINHRDSGDDGDGNVDGGDGSDDGDGDGGGADDDGGGADGANNDDGNDGDHDNDDVSKSDHLVIALQYHHIRTTTHISTITISISNPNTMTMPISILFCLAFTTSACCLHYITSL